MTTQKRTGRPSKSQSEQTFKDNSIHVLLIAKMPAPFVRNETQGNEAILDTLRLAKALGVSRYTVYRMLNDEKMSKLVAVGLLRVSDGCLSDTDLLPYLMRL